MALYYVSSSRGSDSTGTGSATNPWQTIGAAIGPTPKITLSGTGDVVYVEPGTPYREIVTLSLSPTLAGPLSIIGDCDGTGFLAGGYATPATGQVEWLGWSNDTTALTATATLYATGKSYVTIQGFQITGSNTSQAACALYVTGVWSNWTVANCILIPHQLKTVTCWFDGTAGAAMNLTFTQNTVVSPTGGIGVEIRPPLHTAEYSLGNLIQNSLFYGGGSGARLTQTGSGSFLATGQTIQNCSFVFGGGASAYTSSAVTLTTKIGIYGCYFFNGSVSANNTSVIDEDYNDFYVTTPRTAVSIGAHSRIAANPRLNFGGERLVGLSPRPFMEPLDGSPQLGFGNGGTPPAVDISGRMVPAGSGSLLMQVGCFGRQDTATVQTGTVQAGSAAEKLGPGPGTQEWRVPVAASATTLTIYTNADANYGTATPPVFEVLAEPAIGVSAASTTAPANTGTWNQLSLTTFTPSAAGWVTVRVTARPAAANGVCYIDTFGGATGDPSALATALRGGVVPKFVASLTTNVTNNYIFNSEC
ncbi:MAG: hypothetical protein P4L67_04875 [Candidatus Pacebacteria bacterium]|nr:hypothetical protein [Candidatus Paceibacterota bacterium]